MSHTADRDLRACTWLDFYSARLDSGWRDIHEWGARAAKHLAYAVEGGLAAMHETDATRFRFTDLGKAALRAQEILASPGVDAAMKRLSEK